MTGLLVYQARTAVSVEVQMLFHGQWPWMISSQLPAANSSFRVVPRESHTFLGQAAQGLGENQ